MNDHIWDILYVLVGIGLFVYSMIKKKRPENAQEEGESVTMNPVVDVFRDPLEAFFREAYPSEPVKIPVTAAVREPYIEEYVPDNSSLETIVDEEDQIMKDNLKSITEIYNKYNKSSNFKIEEPVPMEMLEDEDHENFEFNPREAIIYSEIIKPRYF